MQTNKLFKTQGCLGGVPPLGMGVLGNPASNKIFVFNQQKVLNREVGRVDCSLFKLLAHSPVEMMLHLKCAFIYQLALLLIE
jgi:hypothetical protein